MPLPRSQSRVKVSHRRTTPPRLSSGWKGWRRRKGGGGKGGEGGGKGPEVAGLPEPTTDPHEPSVAASSGTLGPPGSHTNHTAPGGKTPPFSNGGWRQQSTPFLRVARWLVRGGIPVGFARPRREAAAPSASATLTSPIPGSGSHGGCSARRGLGAVVRPRRPRTFSRDTFVPLVTRVGSPEGSRIHFGGAWRNGVPLQAQPRRSLRSSLRCW